MPGQIIIAPPKLTALEDIPIATMSDLEHEFSNINLDGMCNSHNELIREIIDGEEELIT